MCSSDSGNDHWPVVITVYQHSAYLNGRPDHRKVTTKRVLQFNMEPTFYYLQHFPDERNIANLPWVKALKRRRAGLPSSLDTFTTCPNRTMPKLSSIDIDGRSTEETNA